ncbi:MAG: glycosyltransferase family 4 protein, partial [Planctomycetes bacterium]|nr:glycosyltransferase family 4 protein [Planctomycetota bacterium]
MNILMVLSSQKFPPDRRVEREARDLIRSGHRVYLMARRGPGQDRLENVDGVHVIRVWLPFQKNRILCDMAHYLFQRYAILFSILSACRQHDIRALHVHDLPYAFATSLAGWMLGIPVVFDMHEHYTAMLQMGFDAPAYRQLRPFAFMLLTVLRLEERFACRRAHRIIVVASEHIPRIESLGIPPDRIVVVTNTEDPDQFAGFAIDDSIVKQFADDFVILYVGAFNPHRGLDTAIDAMPAVIREIPNAKLLLVGDGISQKQLHQRAIDAGLADRVIFPGFQPFRLLPTYIEASAVCLIPHISTPHIETTMPNKIFQFMILGRPTVATDVAPLRRVIDDAECGLVYKERDAAALAETILQLKDENLRKRLGDNGKRAVLDRYNWPQTVLALLAIYRELAP